MVARNNLDFDFGETWTIELACCDNAGAPLDLTGATVDIRIANETAILFDLSSSSGGVTILPPPTAGLVVAQITGAQQIAAGIAPGVILYEARATLIDGTVSDQSYGNIAVRQSLWRLFP